MVYHCLQTTKLNIADMASLMPTGDSEEMAALLPRLMELQSRLDQVEGLAHFYTTHDTLTYSRANFHLVELS